jgi:hypothetical protein
MFDIARLAPKTDWNRHGDRYHTGILGSEKGDAELRTGIGDHQQALAARDLRANQAAGKTLRPVPKIPVGQTVQQAPPCIEEIETGLSLRSIVQCLTKASKATATKQ